MIEFQNHGIPFPAVDTRRRRQEGPDTSPVLKGVADLIGVPPPVVALLILRIVPPVVSSLALGAVGRG